MTKQEFAQKTEILSKAKAIELARLYAEVFGAPPWNEVWRCPSCSRFYGPEYSQNTPSQCCSIPLAIAYPKEEIMDYIREELLKPKARLGLFCSPEGKLVAFTWGYEIRNATVLAQKKWPQSQETQNQVIQVMAQFTNPEMPFYYISEVGVSPPSRGNGIGLQLTKDLLDYGIALLQEPVIFRTNWASPMMRIADRLRMTQIMGPKIEVINNEITKTEEIAGFIDGINPDRVLFIKKPQL